MRIKTKEVEYNSRYYQQNKDRLNEEKKKRYETDPEYREAVIRRSVERRRRLSEEKKIRGTWKKKAKPHKYRIMVGEKEVVVLMFTTSQLAKAFQRTAQTIRVWEQKGIIPEAMYRMPCSTYGGRLYTEFQVIKLREAYSKAVREQGAELLNKRISQSKFPGYAAEIWRQYPQGVDPADYY